MRTDEITAFRRARPHVPSYDPEAKARARARLITESSRSASSVRHAEPPHRGRAGTARRRLLVAGALAGALTAGTAAVQWIPRDGDLTRIDRAPALSRVASVQDFADRAQEAASRRPDGRPRPDQWVYVKDVSVERNPQGGPTTTREWWYRVDGLRMAHVQRGRVQIQPTVEEIQRVGHYPYLFSLPSDPDALLKQAYRVAEGHFSRLKSGRRPDGGAGTPPPRAAEDSYRQGFLVITGWMASAALPPRLRAAMYGALAKIPGVRYEPGSKDHLGRRGVTIFRVDDIGLRREVIVNPATYEVLGGRAVFTRDFTAPDGQVIKRKGQVHTWWSLARSALVDEPGRRP